MTNQINYIAYKHKQTGKIIKACRFKYGMEDGKDLIKGQYKPFVIAWNNGYKQKVYVSEKKYIVLSVSYSQKKKKNIEYKFIFDKDIIKKFYVRIKEGNK